MNLPSKQRRNGPNLGSYVQKGSWTRLLSRLLSHVRSIDNWRGRCRWPFSATVYSNDTHHTVNPRCLMCVSIQFERNYHLWMFVIWISRKQNITMITLCPAIHLLIRIGLISPTLISPTLISPTLISPTKDCHFAYSVNSKVALGTVPKLEGYSWYSPFCDLE